ncbi:MAG: cation:proton antiporter [Deltaproteobacteria bacterium]|nr:cation:proton antiporter [Deltaproteobacteria bacterium]
MHDAHEFLTALATVLCVAGVMTVVSQRLRLPVVVGYVLAGLVVGPHVPIPLVADRAIVQTLSELGVILVMFSLGLEFHLTKLARVGPAAGLTGLIECSAMFWLGFSAADLLGWSPRESLFTGALVAISSTTVIVKAFEERAVRAPLRERVIGILVVEDLLAILLLALLPAAALGEAVSWQGVAASLGKLAGILGLALAAGLFVVPRAMRAVLALGRAETALVASLGVCFAGALAAQALGYSVALGAFLAGSLVSEAGDAPAIERLVHPVRDLFAAIFFVSVGMLLDPRLALEHWPAVAAITAVVIVGKLASVGFGVFLTGGGTRTAVESGMSLAQIGEFSFIIAALGVTTGATGEFLFPVAVAASVITMVATPAMIRAAPRAAAFLDRKLPRRVQTFAALYGSWVEKLGGATQREQTLGANLRRLAGWLALDALLLGTIAIGASLRGASLSLWLAGALGIGTALANAIVFGAALALTAPFVLGIVRISKRIGIALARVALPDARTGQLDLSIAPRRALVVTLQLAAVMLVGLPLLALAQPFLPSGAGPAALALTLAGLAFSFWRTAADLQGHVTAGASAVIEALASQARGGMRPVHAPALGELARGLGEPEAVRIAPGCAACGATLSALDLRGLTGATVLAITRGERAIVFPSAGERLEAGDLLALAGTREAVDAAKALLARA